MSAASVRWPFWLWLTGKLRISFEPQVAVSPFQIAACTEERSGLYTPGLEIPMNPM